MFSSLSNSVQWSRNVQLRGTDRERGPSRPLKRPFPGDKEVGFLEYHKANGHASLQVLKKRADKLGQRILNVDECTTCTAHAFLLDFLNGRKPETTSHSILEIFHFHVSAC